ncbi:MAG TPA: TadE/TadG family type IV pilus assembly protein [Pirellulales bacterium]|nr:TadE/TadG family type IV pilus assembly protein [Pirellulales bacterium]
MSCQTHNTEAVPTALIRRRGRVARRRRGTTAVEFAFVGSTVFLIFFGVLELGRALMVTHLLTNAARAGARAGVIEGTSTASIKSVVQSALTSVGISGENVTVQVNDGSTDASASQAGDEITVKATISASSVSWLPWQRFTGSTTLTGQYTLQRE